MSSGAAAERRPDGMPVGRPFAPGQSGNPAGRRPGVARVFKDAVDPETLAAFFVSIVQDEKARPSDRLAAAREILDRGYGKAPAFAAIEGHDPLELDEVSAAIERIQDELAARRNGA